MIIFSSVRFLSKKITKPIFFLKTETGSNRPVSVRFFREKTSPNQFFSVLARFFFTVFLVSVRFGFFGFLLIKPKSNQTGWFFKILIDLISFFYSIFLVFLNFFNLINFLIILLTLMISNSLLAGDVKHTLR